jgi:hypothetical protein
MSNVSFQRSIWTTIRSALTDVGADEISIREEVASILVDALSSVGAAEIEYSYTGIAVETDFPEAFVFDEDGKTLRAVQIIGRPSNGMVQRVNDEQVVERIGSLIHNIESTHDSNAEYRDSGADGLGEFVHLLRERGRSITSFQLKVVVLGNCGDPDELEKIPNILRFGNSTATASIDVYDMNKLQKLLDEDSDNGTVAVDFREFVGGPLRCLHAPVKNDAFDTYLAIIPGDALASIYERFQSRILQKNLRNYLQASGKVNKGIQKSLKEQPEKFLAFNNGITVTASSAVINENGQIEILNDFQIVNGGQTTASLDYARRFIGVDIAPVAVQAKIVVIDIESDPSFIDDVSNYANSQNKVKMSDFASRDSFQVALAELLRDNENLVYEWEDGRRNFWYYEAFRGGYKTELGQLNGKKRKKFERDFPKSQVVDKLELAKCENGWDGYPYFVCRGNDMNFTAWVKRTKPQKRDAPDLTYCKETIAKVILWRCFLDLVKDQGFSGFRSQISAISYSNFVFLLEGKNFEVDLQKIWELGHVPVELRDEMCNVIHFTRDLLTSLSGGEDPAQWAKKPISWEKIQLSTYRDLSKLVSRLKIAHLLRQKSVNLDLLCTRAIDLLEKSRTPLGRVDFINQLMIDESDWDKFRRELLSSGEVLQTGTGPGTKYVIGS